jgi:DNA-binding NarL/FixJ family response regulator
MDKIRILIVDDHLVLRSGLKLLLELEANIEVLADAANAEDAIRLASELQPDVILMDIQLPVLNGIEATKRIKSTNPRILILMLTMFQDDDSVFAAVRAGAQGYLLKGASQEEIGNAIRGVARGEAIFGAGVAERVLRFFSATRPAVAPSFPELTAREREILELIAQKCSNATIALRLDLSPKTVRNYVSNIISKLQVADRSEAIWVAKNAGIGA